MNQAIVPIEVSARHAHLSRADTETLFGAGYQLRNKRDISQPGQFAAEETVIVEGPKGSLSVRIIGPERTETQVELSMTDCISIGVTPTVAMSGDLKQSAGGVTLRGSAGSVTLARGVIVAQRHLHISPEQASERGLNHKDVIAIRVGSDRRVIFENVVVRSRPGVDTLSFMLDTDEANAAGVRQGDTGEIVADS